MVNDPDRADVLVAEAGHAITAARYYLSVASPLVTRPGGGIARCENDELICAAAELADMRPHASHSSPPWTRYAARSATRPLSP